MGMAARLRIHNAVAFRLCACIVFHEQNRGNLTFFLIS